MLFSIVIPVYNAEQYISRCIEKCVQQSFMDFEIILVVNGSTDNSETICSNWKAKDDRIEVITVDVANVSYARNVGVINAIGEWIVFVDSDDYLLPDALEHLAENVENGIDLICCNYVQKNLNGDLSRRIQKITTREYMLAMLDPTMYFYNIKALTWRADMLGVNWAKAFRRNSIVDNNILFDTRITIFEDLLFNLEFLYLNKTVKCIDIPIYFYTINETSLCRTTSLRRIKQRLDYIDNLKVRISDERDEDIKNALEFQAGQNLLRTFVVASKSKEEKGEVRRVIREYFGQSSTRKLLIQLRTNRLSMGKIQDMYFIILLWFLKRKVYLLAFSISGIYARIKKKG